MSFRLHRLALLPLLGALFLPPATGLAASNPLALKASVFSKVYQKVSSQGAVTAASADKLVMRQFHDTSYATLGLQHGYLQVSRPTDNAPVDYDGIVVEILTEVYSGAQQAGKVAPDVFSYEKSTHTGFPSITSYDCSTLYNLPCQGRIFTQNFTYSSGPHSEDIFYTAMQDKQCVTEIALVGVTTATIQTNVMVHFLSPVHKLLERCASTNAAGTGSQAASLRITQVQVYGMVKGLPHLTRRVKRGEQVVFMAYYTASDTPQGTATFSEHGKTVGQQTMTADKLSTGQTYLVAVQTFTTAGTATATFHLTLGSAQATARVTVAVH